MQEWISVPCLVSRIMSPKRIWTPREAQGLLTLNYNSLIIVTFLSMYNSNNNNLASHTVE